MSAPGFVNTYQTEEHRGFAACRGHFVELPVLPTALLTGLLFIINIVDYKKDLHTGLRADVQGKNNGVAPPPCRLRCNHLIHRWLVCCVHVRVTFFMLS